MRIRIAWIGKTKDPAIASLTDEYLKRISRYVAVEGIAVRDEAALLKLCGRTLGQKDATKSTLQLLDSRGQEFTSEKFAQYLENYMDRNPLPLVLAIGAADGFREQTQSAAQGMISLGKMTLPHELARIVLLEQVYRAFTIIKRHPYHTGH